MDTQRSIDSINNSPDKLNTVTGCIGTSSISQNDQFSSAYSFNSNGALSKAESFLFGIKESDPSGSEASSVIPQEGHPSAPQQSSPTAQQSSPTAQQSNDFVRSTGPQTQKSRPRRNIRLYAPNIPHSTMNDNNEKNAVAGSEASKAPSKQLSKSGSKQDPHSMSESQKLPSFSDPSKWAIVPVKQDTANDLWDVDDADSAEMPHIVGENGFFSTKKPKDLGAGLSSGLKSVGKGIAMGAVSMVGMPIAGASKDGVSGFFKGLGQGMFAAVALPVTGLGVGVYQSVRGVVNTPEAVHQRSEGRKWDKKTREWKVNWYSLPEEQEMMESVRIANAADKEERKRSKCSSPEKHSAGSTRIKKVKDTKFYDVLAVTPDASQSEIRKAYYKLARDNHPDKNPNDPTAKERFQRVGEAYQVLGEEERRQKYDDYGASVTEEMQIVDSSFFFTMLFGSQVLEPFIGKLKMAMMVESMLDEPDSREIFSEETLQLEQRRREVTLAVLLRDRLQPFVDAESDEKRREQWRVAMTTEACVLCEASFGDAIVEAVGWVYMNYSSQFLGKQGFLGVSGKYAKLQAQNRNFTTKLQIGTTLVKTTLAARKLQKIDKYCSDDDTQPDSEINACSSQEDKTLTADNHSSSAKNTCQEEGTAAGKSEPKKKKKFKTGLKTKVAGSKGGSAGGSSGSGTLNSTSFDAKYKEESKEDEVKKGKKGKKGKKTQRDEKSKKEKSHEDGVKQFEETLPLILETLLSICLLDVEDTLRQSCKKILKDMTVEESVRTRRAEALAELGKILHAEASSKKKVKGKVDARKQMEEAFIMAAQKADEERNN